MVEPYDKNKIKKSILQALTKRPVTVEEIDKITNEIEQEIYNENETEIKSVDIGEKILKRLKEIDEVAYVRFASVYRNFKEVDNFSEEVESIKNNV